MSSILSVEGVTMRFGGLVANEDVSFTVEPGQIFAVIGPNGAGKTTLFNAITGIYQPTAGRVRFRAKEIRRDLDAGTIARAVLTGLVVSASLVVALNINALWETSIQANFTFGQPFSWGKAFASFFDGIRATGVSWGVVPALLGFAIGCAASLVLWANARRTPDLVARAGIARTFQNIRLFPELDLISNVLVGMDARLTSRYLDALFRTPRFRRERAKASAEAMDLLHFVDLKERADEKARNLPYGHQRRLEIARALASRPALLLLDEPAAGMNPAETIDLMRLIRKVRDRGVTVVLIEHHMRVVMGISDRIVVLQYGKKIAEGTPEEIKCDPRCIEAYLGKEELGVTLLSVENLRAGYGAIDVLHGISVDVRKGEIVSLIGANGAGKTSTLMCISRVNRLRGGRIAFNGTDITPLPAHQVVKLGLAHVPEGRRIFPRLTVRENLEMGAFLRNDRDGIAKDMEDAFTLFPVLKERLAQLGGTLSGGEQQMLAIGRALMSRPTMLMMDEPSMGIAPLLVARIFDAVRELRSRGMTILLVEQNARAALKFSDRGYVLETGNVVLSDTGAALLASPRVREAYLGE